MDTEKENTTEPTTEELRLEFAKLWPDMNNRAIKLGMSPKQIPVLYEITWNFYRLGRMYDND